MGEVQLEPDVASREREEWVRSTRTRSSIYGNGVGGILLEPEVASREREVWAGFVVRSSRRRLLQS